MAEVEEVKPRTVEEAVYLIRALLGVTDIYEGLLSDAIREIRKLARITGLDKDKDYRDVLKLLEHNQSELAVTHRKMVADVKKDYGIE